MTRRACLKLAAAGVCVGSAALVGLSAAQPAKRVARIGLVLNNTPIAEMSGPDPADRNVRAFVHGLRELGRAEGRDLVVERRSARGRPERGPALLQELVDLKVDAIVTTGGPLLRAGRQALGDVPIVFIGVNDPVAVGVVASLARPGGYVTGLTFDAGPAIQGKRLELLRLVAPHVTRVAVLQYNPVTAPPNADVAAAARTLGLTLVRLQVQAPEDYDAAFTTLARERAQAIVVPQSGPNFAAMRRIVDFAARQRLPAIYELREYVQAGGLMSYGTDVADLYRRAAALAVKILDGARPAELPVEQPTKFELLVNRTTAKALGIVVPQSVLLRADEVIE